MLFHHILAIACDNMLGEDSNISATIGQGLTVTNEVILQELATNKLVCCLVHRHQHVRVDVRTPTSDNFISFQMWKNTNIWERM